MKQEKTKTIRFRWSIDMINEVGNLKRVPLALIWQTGEWICRRENYMWQYVRRYENGDIETLITVQRLKFHKHFDNPVWVQYNPNHLRKEDIEQLERVMSSVDHAHLTRVDLACDIYNIPLTKYDFGLFNLTREIRRTKSGDLETRYWGAGRSERLIRLYDKKRERTAHKKEDDIPEWAEDWWRLEFQFRQGKVEKWEEEILDKMGSFQVLALDDNDDISEVDKAVLRAVNDDKFNFKNVGKAYAAKIRKMVRENVGFDTTVADMAIIAFKQQQSELKATLEDLMIKYNIRPEVEELTRYFEIVIDESMAIDYKLDENDVAYRKAFRKAIKNWRDDKQLSPEQ